MYANPAQRAEISMQPSLDSTMVFNTKTRRHRWDLSISDIACGAEAVFWLEVQKQQSNG